MPRPHLKRTDAELRPFLLPGQHVDFGQVTYWRVRNHLELERRGRGPMDRHRHALRCAQVGFLRLAAELEVEDIAAELETPPRTVERSLRDLRESVALPRPQPRPIPNLG